MPGPLPNPQRRRRNASTIPTSVLPGTGRKGRPPKCPYDLGRAGEAWWSWAWRTPQATRWDKGALYGLARRAQLEDELASLAEIEAPDLASLLSLADEQDGVRQLEWLLGRLQSRATGSTTLMREMRELDNRFGLNAKAMADLRWSIADDEEAGARDDEASVPTLVLVDPRAA